MQILKAEHISVETKDKKILHDISFQIEKGDFLCVIGKNGSGKTTLLKTLAKLITPTNGNIFINEKNISTLSREEIAKQMSVVFQNSYNDLDFKVWDVYNNFPMRPLNWLSPKEFLRKYKSQEEVLSTI